MSEPNPGTTSKATVAEVITQGSQFAKNAGFKYRTPKWLSTTKAGPARSNAIVKNQSTSVEMTVPTVAGPSNESRDEQVYFASWGNPTHRELPGMYQCLRY